MKGKYLLCSALALILAQCPTFGSDNPSVVEEVKEEKQPATTAVVPDENVSKALVTNATVDQPATVVVEKSEGVPKVAWGYSDFAVRSLWYKTMNPEIEKAKFVNIDLRLVCEWIKDYKLENCGWKEWKGVTFANITGLRGDAEYYYGEAMIYDIDYGQLIHTKQKAGNEPFTTAYTPRRHDIKPSVFVEALVKQQQQSATGSLFLKEIPEKKQAHQTLTSTTYELYTNDPNHYFKLMVVRYGSDTEPLSTDAVADLRGNAQGILELKSVKWKQGDGL